MERCLNTSLNASHLISVKKFILSPINILTILKKVVNDNEEQERPKQFKKYLNEGVNKVDLVKFFREDWSDPISFNTAIPERVVFVTVESGCHQLAVIDNKVVSRGEDCLCSNQEEADTKMFLCCQHATQPDRNFHICISTVDSDVANLAVYYKCSAGKCCSRHRFDRVKNILQAG